MTFLQASWKACLAILFCVFIVLKCNTFKKKWHREFHSVPFCSNKVYKIENYITRNIIDGDQFHDATIFLVIQDQTQSPPAWKITFRCLFHSSNATKWPHLVIRLIHMLVSLYLFRCTPWRESKMSAHHKLCEINNLQFLRDNWHPIFDVVDS